MAPGTHLYSVREAHERIADGRSPLLRLVMNKGDVLIRDLLCWHRCTPHDTSQRTGHFLLFSERVERIAGRRRT